MWWTGIEPSAMKEVFAEKKLRGKRKQKALMPYWQRTSEQDWTLVENVQKGVLSSAYRPGPLSKSREYNVAQFIDWYLGRLGA